MYRVRWLKVALDALTTLWLNADSATRIGITQATHEIDQRLADDPGNEGESREHGLRILFAKPLGINSKWIRIKRPAGLFRFGNSRDYLLRFDGI